MTILYVSFSPPVKQHKKLYNNSKHNKINSKQNNISALTHLHERFDNQNETI